MRCRFTPLAGTPVGMPLSTETIPYAWDCGPSALHGHSPACLPARGQRPHSPPGPPSAAAYPSAPQPTPPTRAAAASDTPSRLCRTTPRCQTACARSPAHTGSGGGTGGVCVWGRKREKFTGTAVGRWRSTYSRCNIAQRSASGLCRAQRSTARLGAAGRSARCSARISRGRGCSPLPVWRTRRRSRPVPPAG